MNREGFKSPKWGHLGVYFLCTGPDPSGPRPGERVRVVIYDTEDRVVRRFEQTAGEVTDPGHVDFFTERARPEKRRMPLVDIAPDGRVTSLCDDFQPDMGRTLFATIFEAWVRTHGVMARAAAS